MDSFANGAAAIVGHIGPIPVYLFGLTTAVGLFVGTAVALLQADRFGLSTGKLFEFAPLGIVAGVVGARVGYIVTHWGDYRGALAAVTRLSEGGFSFYGALACGAAAWAVYSRVVAVDGRRGLDALAPALALGQAVGLVGVQIVGRTTSMPWGVAIQHTSIHPLPAYGIVLTYALFFILWRLGKERVRPGSLFLTYLLLHGSGSVVLGMWSSAPSHAGLTVGQWGGLAVAVIALTFMFKRRHERLPETPVGSPWHRIRVNTPADTAGARITEAGLWLTGLLVLLFGFVARLP